MNSGTLGKSPVSHPSSFSDSEAVTGSAYAIQKQFQARDISKRITGKKDLEKKNSGHSKPFQ